MTDLQKQIDLLVAQAIACEADAERLRGDTTRYESMIKQSSEAQRLQNQLDAADRGDA